MIRTSRLPSVPSMRFHACAAALLSLSLWCAGAALAADKPKKEGSLGTGKSSAAILTKEQLRVCLTQQARVVQQDDELLKEQAALGGIKAEIARSGDALKDQLDSTDRSNAEAVAAYNLLAQARDQQIDAYQARVTAFNGRVESIKVERDGFGKACENRRFLEEDEIAIKKGK